jgi:iron complex outermembrane receptor protein
MSRITKTILQSTVAACALVCAAPAAFAQTAPAAEAELGEVVVTGSLIQRNGYDQPTPVTTTTAEQLLAAAPQNIPTALNQLPQFSSSSTRSRCCAGGAQGEFLNLRGLGPNRTLVLLDGDRLAPTTETGVVDANLLPEMLIQRVDIVTGGASAAYGSDAVSGVVNYVIDRRFKGLKLEAQGGINHNGDDKSVKLGVAGGTDFADGRGRIVGSIQHFRQDGLFRLDQFPLPCDGYFYAGNGSAATPWNARCGVVNASLTNGGIITTAAGVPIADAANPLAGTLFLAGGSSRPAVVGAAIPGSSAVFRSGGDGSIIDGAGPSASVYTNKVYGRIEFDLTDTLTFSARLNAAESENFQPFNLERDAVATAFTIFRENAFLPADIAARMDQARVSSFRLGRINREFGRYTNDYYSNTFDFAFGLDGRLAKDWTWHAGYSNGETKMHGQVTNNPTLVNLFAAADAVRDANGNIVCRVSVTNPGAVPGCVPINLFGEGAPSQAAMNFILGASEQRVTNTQERFTATAQGSVFELPAGEVMAAVGVEYRKRSLVQTADSISTSQINPTGIRGFPTSLCPTATTCRFGAHATGNYGTADARDNAKEIYGEVVVPLLRDAPFAKYAELNGAVRRTDYSNSGVVHTWKVGASYEPFDGLRLRATRSRDIRAPNLFDLFQGPITTFGLIRGIPQSVTSIARGNPDLQPEIGDTTTFGVVYRPNWLEGFSGSVDSYTIEMKDAISSLTAQQTVDLCSGGDTAACANINRDGAGNISSIIVRSVNLAERTQRGMDLDLTYAREIGPGKLTLRGVGTRLFEFKDNNAGIVVDYAGTMSVLDVLNAAKWRGNLSLNYEWGNFSVFAQERIIGSMNIRPPTVATSNYVKTNVPAVFYTDVTVKYRLPDKGIELFGTVNNVFNEKPPFIPSQLQPHLALPTNFNYYGWEIRYFTGGVRVQF